MPERTIQPPRASRPVGWIVAAGLLGVSIAFVALTHMEPGYDAYGWLVWGRQTLHWNLDTNGAPSWKPLTYLFTLPYAPLGRTQPWLWMVTDVALTLAGCVFAGRIAYRLTGATPERRYAGYLAGAFAGLAVLGIDDYWHQIVIANSDPIDVTLVLAAIDCHLCGRPRLAFGALVLASLGRPEAWLSAALYALWLWRAVPGTRIMAVVGIASIPLLWFGISALTAKSWLRAGDLALNSANVIQANKFTGVAGRLLDLYTLPMQIAGGLALILAAVIRDRVWVTLAAAALLWVLVEIAFALHGWSAVPRYLFEPAAVLITLTGAAVGRTVAHAPPGPAALRWAGPAAVAILLVALIPTVSQRIGTLSDQVGKRRVAQLQLHRLQAVIDRLGGPAGVRACGQPVTLVGWQSTVAWETGLNVGNVGYKPGREIERGDPIVLLKPHSGGWQVRPIHTLPARRAACAGLRTDTQFSPS